MCVVCNCSSVQSDSRRHSAENTTPPEGLKRSERLRDRRVHYADMVHGIHPRHGSDVEPKPDEARHHQSSHQTTSKANLPPRESSGRIIGRTSSTEIHAKSKVSPVEPPQSVSAVNCRRQSMELRSSAEVVAKPEAQSPPVVASTSIHPGGRHHPARQHEIRHGSIEESSATEQSTARPATVARRRHRGSARHRRRVAFQRRSKLFPLSSASASPSLDQLPNASQSNISAGTVAVDCIQPNIVTVDSHLVDEPKVSNPVKSVNATESGDASVLRVASVDSDADQKSLRCEESVNKNKTCVFLVSPVPSSCRGGGDASRPKHKSPLSNSVAVMHADFSGRVGRRRRTQEGVVLLDRYVSADAACVRCCSCSEMLSVSEFVRHVHDTNRVDVGSARRLGPCGIASPEWHEFQRRRAEFAVGPGYSRTRVSMPPVEQVTKTTDAETAGSDTDEVGKSMNPVEILPSIPVATAVDEEPTSTPAASQDMKSFVAESTPSPPPVPVMNDITKSSNDDSSSSVVGLASRPLEAIVVTASCPATVDEAEPRVTRSRNTSVSPAKPSPKVRSPRKQSAIAASGQRHSNRSCKRAGMDLTVTTPVRHASNADNISSRLELRPRPPPRASGPK